MKKITAILLFLLISLPHAQAADRLLLKNGLACLKRFELSYDVAFFRYSSKLVDKSTYRSWAEVVEETFENAGKKTVFDLIENREFELAHKKLLIELENNGPLKFDIIKGSKEYLIIKKLITNNNPEAVKLSLFLTGHFSPNPFLSRDSNLKLAQFYKCLGEKQFYPNTIFPFHLIFEKPNHKSACTQYQKSPEILDPCGIGTGGSGGGSGGDLPMEYIGSYDAGGGFVGHAFEADISGNSPINEIGGGPDLGTLGFSGPGATGEPGGGIPTSPTGNNDQSEEENQPENQRDSNSESDSEAKSEFEKEVEGALSKIADEGLKESIKRAMDDVENENEKKRDAQKEAILNSFNILIPRKILTPEEERVLRSLQRGENPGRAAVESLNNEKPRHYEFASENGDFLDRAENLYKKVSNIKSQGVTGEHPLSLRNIRNTAKHLSLVTIEASDQANFLGDKDAANTGLEIAKALADVALGVTPGLSIVSDAYSFFYGKHVLFGTELSVSDRVFAGIGLLTLGGSNWLKHGGKILGKALIRFAKSPLFLETFKKIASNLNGLINSAMLAGFNIEGFNNLLSILKNERGSITIGGDLSKSIGKIKDVNLWSRGKHNHSLKNAVGHYKKHKKEFPEITDAIEYVEMAHDFIKSPPPNTLTKIRSNGDMLYYNPNKNIFVVKGKDGAPKTMFRPSPERHGYPNNMEYFNAQ